MTPRSAKARAAVAPLLAALIALPVFWCAGPSHARGPQSVAPVAEKLIEAVVNISTSQTVKGPQGTPLPKVPKGSPFEEFFDDFFSKKGGRQSQDRKVSSLGSGFVVDGVEGLIVTNHHVIEGADEIIVNFHDGSKLKVDKVIGRDTKTDLALLKVTPKKPLAAVKFGSSESLKVGDWVLAIGNPFGLGGSVTVGIISAKQRDINSGPYDDYLQTDAAINKGNSGGPLFDMEGAVIGVNTAIISPTGGSIGIGFAVPSDTAVAVIDQLRQYGETRRGWLGVRVQTVTEETAEALGIGANAGALVAAVSPDSPAAAAGIVAGDVVMKFDGKDVSTMRGLPRLVAQAPVGKTVDVELMRKNERIVKKVVVGRLAEDDAKPNAAEKKDEKSEAPPAAEETRTLAGLKLAPLSEDLRKRYGFGRKARGVVIVEIDALSPASKDLKPGDLVVEAAQEPVTTVADIMKGVEKIRKAGRKAILFRIEDAKGDLRFVAVPIG